VPHSSNNLRPLQGGQQNTHWHKEHKLCSTSHSKNIFCGAEHSSNTTISADTHVCVSYPCCQHLTAQTRTGAQA